MIAAGGMRRRAAGLVLCLAIASPAAATAVEAPATAAVIVHLTGGPSPSLPASAAAMRQAAQDLSSALLYARNVTVVDRNLTESLVRRHVVRTGQSFGPGFLTGLAAETGASILVAISLEAEGSRLTVAARAVDTANGCLLGIGHAEAEVGPGGWQQALTSALRDAMPSPGRPGPGAELLVLPARSVGTPPQAARAATSSLLAIALAEGGWRPVDPALVAGAVAEAGCDLDRLDARARTVLRERFGADWAVVPEIVSFDAAARTSPALEFVEGAGGRQANLSEFALNLRLLDLRTGLVRRTTWAHLPGGTVHGWFGHVKNPTELQRIRTAADQAWARFHGFLQEKAS